MVWPISARCSQDARVVVKADGGVEVQVNIETTSHNGKSAKALAVVELKGTDATGMARELWGKLKKDKRVTVFAEPPKSDPGRKWTSDVTSETSLSVEEGFLYRATLTDPTQ